MVLGLVSLPLVCLYYIGIPVGIAAFITGLIARRQIKDSAGAQSGNGMAIAGIATGLTSGVILFIAIGTIVILALLGPAIGNVFSNIVMNI